MDEILQYLMTCCILNLVTWFYPGIKISVNTDISIIRFYENIGKILVDILTKILINNKLFKNYKILKKDFKK